MYNVKNIAKVSRPAIKNMYPRKRLFNLLDDARQNSVVWMQAPPGSGKTTVVSSYVEAIGLPHIWYQVDDGDEDIASFFYFMKVAACNFSSSKCENIPSVSPEKVSNLVNFSRNYFRALFNEFTEPGVIVIDDFHEAPVGSILLSVLQSAVREIPVDIQVIFISREEPPAAFAKLRMNNALSLLSWAELQLTHEECKGISDLYCNSKKFNKSQVTDLCEKTQGWAAGLVLLLQGNDDKNNFIFDESDKTVVFDYFAGEFFEKELPHVQHFLLKTSILGTFTLAMADEVCGYNGASEAIATFCSRNYFVTQRGEKDNITYAFHPMFREFLQSKFESTLDEHEIINTKKLAAGVLTEAGDINSATTQLVAIADWEALKAHILSNIEHLLQQGRYWTAKSWLSYLPEEIIDADPWLIYWLARSKQPFFPKECHENFKNAYNAFLEKKHYEGAYLTWAMAVESIIFGGADMTPIDFWIAQLNQLINISSDFKNQELEARVVCCIFSANLWRNFDDAEHVDYWAKRARALLDAPIAPKYHVVIGTALVAYYGRWLGDLSKCRVLAERIAAFIDDVELSPLTLMMWYVVESMSLWMSGRAEVAIKNVDKGIKELEKSGVKIMMTRLKTQTIYANLALGEFEKCHNLLSDLFSQEEVRAEKYESIYHFLMACLALEEGKFSQGKEQAEIAMELVDPYDSPLRFGFINLVRAQCLYESGNVQQAYDALERSEQWANNIRHAHVQFQCLLSRAHWIYEQTSEEKGLVKLQEALSFGKAKQFVSHPWWGWRRPAVIQIYNAALENNIESEYVKDLIRINKVIPTDTNLVGGHWPWLLTITTLGSFSILLNGSPINQSGKLQGKSLELLKYIVLYGGKNVGIEPIIDYLWPDVDGDASHHSFETTLYRLRKTLGNNNVLTLQNGRVSLNNAYVWIDVWALEHALKRLDTAVAKEAPPQEINKACQALFDLYVGDFFAYEDQSSVVSNSRDKLQQSVLRALIPAGCYLENKGEWQNATNIYQNGILIAPLTEKFYTRLMVCQLELGQNSDVILTYKRCQDALQSGLGTSPSKETEAIHFSVTH